MTPEKKSKFNFVYANAKLGLTDVRSRKRVAPLVEAEVQVHDEEVAEDDAVNEVQDDE